MFTEVTLVNHPWTIPESWFWKKKLNWTQWSLMLLIWPVLYINNFNSQFHLVLCCFSWIWYSSSVFIAQLSWSREKLWMKKEKCGSRKCSKLFPEVKNTYSPSTFLTTVLLLFNCLYFLLYRDPILVFNVRLLTFTYCSYSTPSQFVQFWPSLRISSYKVFIPNIEPQICLESINSGCD